MLFRSKYVATPSPANPAYGAQFWVYGGRDGLPADAYSPNGAAGQYAMIVPSKGVIVVRRGIDRGQGFNITQFSADVIAALGLADPIAAQAPDGWRVRVDRSENAQDPDDVPQIKFIAMGKGFHVTSGPAGTFWHPAHTPTGDYTVKATFTLMKPSGHTNYYGLIFGGSDIEGAAQNYLAEGARRAVGG